MHNEGAPKITPTHETDESRMWDTLLINRQRLEGDISKAREKHTKAQEDAAAFRESTARVLANMDALEAEARIRLAGNDEALQRAIEKIENVRRIEAECAEAYTNEEAAFDHYMQNLVEFEEALDGLEQELTKSRQ